MTESINDQICKASLAGDMNEVKRLMFKGSDIDTKDSLGWTPLLYACNNNHMEIVKLLLDGGAKITSESYSGWSPIVLVNSNGNIELVKLLLEYSADINVFTNTRISRLEHQKKIWSDESIQELIINKQPHNIKFLDVKVGLLPSLREKYKEIIELSQMGLF